MANAHAVHTCARASARAKVASMTQRDLADGLVVASLLLLADLGGAVVVTGTVAGTGAKTAGGFVYEVLSSPDGISGATREFLYVAGMSNS